MLVFVLNLYIISAYSQNTFYVDPVTNKVSGFDATYQFSRSYVYDHDLRTFMDPTAVNAAVAIRVENDGSGKLILFVNRKVVFLVDSCIKSGDLYNFHLLNAQGNPVTASLLTNQNQVKSFWLYKQEDNTSIVFAK